MTSEVRKQLDELDRLVDTDTRLFDHANDDMFDYADKIKKGLRKLRQLLEKPSQADKP